MIPGDRAFALFLCLHPEAFGKLMCLHPREHIAQGRPQGRGWALLELNDALVRKCVQLSLNYGAVHNSFIYLFICYNSQRFPITVNVHVKD